MRPKLFVAMSVLLIAAFASSALAFKPIPKNRNPYHNQVFQSYEATMAAYRSLMACYQRYYLNPQAYMVAYYRYTRQLATYKAILQRYQQWRPKPNPGPVYPDPEPDPQPDYERKRVLIQAENLYYPAVMPGPVNLGQINGNNVHKHVNVRPGQLVIFKLVTNGSTGYSWNQRVVGGSNVTITKESSATSTNPMVCGAPSIVTYRVQAKKAGRAVITLRYRRSWEAQAAARLVVLSLNIQQRPSTSGKYLAIENHQSRSRVTYRVTDETLNVVKSFNGKEVTLTGEFERGPTPYSGTVKAIAAQLVGNSPPTDDIDDPVDNGNNNNNDNPTDLPDYGDIIYSY